MSRRRTGLREGGLVVLATVIVGVGAGVAIHALNGGGGSSAQDNPPGLHGQATWNPGKDPLQIFGCRTRAASQYPWARYAAAP